ncbi:nitrous oxidase accessory protein [Constrictibacter sp. MBR-5]
MHTLLLWSAGLAAICAASPAPACAAVLEVAPGSPVQTVIGAASPGDVVALLPGVHKGPVTLDNAVVLDGRGSAELAGPGTGTVVTVTAPRAVVRGLTIRGSGRNLQAMDSAVFVHKEAAGALVEENRIEGNLFGVYLHGAPDSVARRNVIVGVGGRLAERGNGVTVWNAPGAVVAENDISGGRDGIFVLASKRNRFLDNRMKDLRFAVHYMYTNDSEVSGNVSTGNHVGFAIMYSNRLVIRDNVSRGDRDHGLLFNYANQSEIAFNAVFGRLIASSEEAEGNIAEHGVALRDAGSDLTAGGARIGPTKCVFIYNANRNRFVDNWFKGCEIGIHFTAGSEGNAVVGNAFVRNRTQVKYVGTRSLDWSEKGRGNYWSDNPAFDLDRDGIADAAYRPNDIVDKVLWVAPQAKLLISSPAVQTIRWAQSQFPALYPGGVVDSRPLVAPPPVPARASR